VSSYIFDIEADDLLLPATIMWVITFEDIETGAVEEFLGDDLGWKEKIDGATLLAGHNIVGYDIPLLEKLYGYKVPTKVKVRDTLLLSQILDYRRFGMKGHSLEVWGEFLGNEKHEFTDYKCPAEGESEVDWMIRMRDYCRQDVHLNLEVYEILMEEFKIACARAPLLKHYVQAEHFATEYSSQGSLKGWPFDREAAEGLMVIFDREMDRAYGQLSSQLGSIAEPKDKYKGEAQVKEPKWTKFGIYDSTFCKWFEIDPCSGFPGEERMVEGPYCRLVIRPLSLDSVTDVKTFLYRNGWVPTEWNRKFDQDTRKWKETSPKITDDSIEFLGGDGVLYKEFLSVKSRHGVLKTWLANVDDNGNLHGEMKMVGTPSMRATHKIIANVPSTDKPYGPEMRKLFRAKEGWKLIGCDSKGNQARGLAHYLGDATFIDTLLNGDIHQYNADVLTQVLGSMGIEHTVPRSNAKRILYAFLFGASGGKLWSYVFGNIDQRKGNKLRKGFLKAVPGFQQLIDKLENIYGATNKSGYGYIPSLCGNRIYVDSFHKLLVYLLQACEKITCSTALMLTVREFRAKGIPYQPCIYYQDEIDFMVPDEYADQACEISERAFEEGARMYGITIMAGHAQQGQNWLEVH
jgi:DNA polymerase-1